MSSIIKVNNLVKQYEHAKEPSVKGISFDVKEGEFFAFLGPNGAGKTTTISILTTTLAKTSGELQIAGFDIDKQAKEIREQVGIIFQKPSLDQSLSAEENIRFHACLYGMYPYRPSFKMMPKAYQKSVLELAEILGIKDSLFKPIKKMSGGMQRKLEIIRSLIHTPKVLFLDEPTQGLDAVSRRSLWQYLEQVRSKYGTTIFLTTHYIDEAEKVDKVCIINNGSIAYTGTPDEMKRNLLRQELIIDAVDRDSLLAEVKGLGLPYQLDQQLVIPFYQKSPQEIIQKIKTELSVLKVVEPTLEDAYVAYIHKNGGITA